MPVKLNTNVSAEELRQALDYNPDTGVFTWREMVVPEKGTTRSDYSRRSNAIGHNKNRAGCEAGLLDAKGYRRIKFKRSYRGANRLAVLYMTGFWPADEVDHINGNPGDNRYKNLRVATRSQNQANAAIRRNNKVGLKGVCFRNGSYRAQIKKNNKVIALGRFATAEDAHAAYVEAATRMHGEFARHG